MKTANGDQQPKKQAAAPTAQRQQSLALLYN